MQPAEAEGHALDAQAALQKLEEYGERFMSMFDDDGRGRSALKPSTSGRSPRAAPSAEVAAGGRAKRERSAGPAAEAAASGQGSRPPAVAAAQRGQAGQPPLNGGGAPTPGLRKQDRGTNEIDVIMRAGKKAKRSHANAPKHHAADLGADQPDPAPGRQQAAADDALRRERKLFMSHKASKVHAAVGAEPPQHTRRGSSATARGEGSGLSPDEFQTMQLEVERFAASSLDKKSAKEYKARMLARVGAKAEATPRMPASIGLGIAKMAVKRQARALEEAIETGMVQRKGLGKKKRVVQAKSRDRGLMEAGKGFKNGVLRVKPMKKASSGGGMLKLPKGVL
ncbi:hypothetical protein TSOC_000665 [Tetrabaena socialis]|uniref:Uncharacterized protein n=1 Tax=Tetrabaena socialis TaxID=47790 RepID=A0A2J8AIM6_9CHLO|nr:hypothetical protein TSOC_000665 [Tetrabaena socialis]|eukprot:PNH12367.1 hypothetical protein TSOC_000665 [Tetrabaena socialis]